MLANVIIILLVVSYCIFVIRREYRNMKEGKHTGCGGCTGCCGSCSAHCTKCATPTETVHQKK